MDRYSKGIAHLFVIIILALAVVGGIGYYAYKNGQISFISKNQTVTPPSPRTSEVTNWETYKSENYNFEFMYPDNLKIANRGPGPHESVVDSIDFTSMDNPQIFNLTIYSTRDTLSDFIKKNLNILFPPNMQKESSFETEHISVEKYLYKESSPNLPISFIYFFSNQANIFAFQVSNANDEKVNIADQILSTFRFLDTTASGNSDLSSFTNSVYKFSIRYPSSWTVYTPNTVDGSCKTDAENKNLVIFSKTKLTNCGFVGEQLTPQDADVTVRVHETEWEDPYNILGTPDSLINIAGETAAKYIFDENSELPNVKATRIYFNRKNKGYLIFLKQKDLLGNYDAIYDQIISTLEFYD
ncbi:hypothetical protein A2962_00205 [Candidatus Woesebacteria bacterium RIFCSPLOWO2_01_FULL_39_61]|uniref:Uncharacterized protein n=1 Tax=Candidatus Woesebacteria bacterium RIFCSPHIGHO2_02_FULL_39_13 TaxID=1802505 RepID=A0A1F7Z1M2_9BACT|nr:MAG: hypothetical protein A2692_04915 [Candidatus Woesebacteria bacterium RIFCSPHIGHO2_01_FULL_39_95]OGM33556.1 MAG: hypothetical protein A3D01_01215 [Candidatus Woesebacteria bacterium RIFCSPHIGHO2_02_FULL_39_13]OGM36714.1 MAG: hypothetical protein A3E13_00275 [Candidatus Woesebacteria bacterium RIFCSPHIGHO2_12_FULL_40_20]OGM66192.1 MAG: hypothetical protein A2962_00205 [Candidatus Woesebacteria bacterium RIFCSPLOWO2_01_FULL_39_61]OGM71687.1 MAG: hypothetical protein A3H19_01565 [Candidatus